ncbi:MAG TPA: OmpH family outer membrane protein [Geobacteraceae bacterium]
MRKAVRSISFVTLIGSALLALPLLAGAIDTPAATPATTVNPSPAVVEQPKPATPAPTVKLGFVEMLKISQESTMGKASKAKFKEKADKFETQVAAKQKQLEKQKKALEEKMPTLPPKERAAKAKEFEKKVDEYRKYVQGLDKELKPLQEDLTRALYKQIEQAAVAYGKANGFAAIFEKQELLYLDGGVDAQDVTDAVLKLMEQKGSTP